jgi:hypothetical protein
LSSLSWLWDIMHSFGGYLVNDDITDFPFTDVASSKHPGIMHHGAIGLAMQTVAYVGAVADVGAEMARELQEKDEIQEIIECWEPIAYPLPSM